MPKFIKKNPDAFGPNLAFSLATVANAEEYIGDLTAATHTNTQAIHMLEKSFYKNPNVHRDKMMSMIQQYKRCRRRMGLPPEHAVIGALEITLRTLQS
jgi:hypothetical protein